MNLGRRIVGVPLLLWVLVALLVAVVAGAVILSNILQTTTHVSPPSSTAPIALTWVNQLPASITIGQAASWWFTYGNTNPSNGYNIVLAVDLAAGQTLDNAGVVMFQITNGPWGAQTVPLAAISNGHLHGGTNAVAIGPGATGNVQGLITFNSNAPTVDYTLQFWIEQG